MNVVLGAFNPFFRNHNGIDNLDQDPGSFSAAAVTSNRKVVELRYTLIPFLYSLFYRIHITGGTVVRSMAHVFPTIPECWPLDEQFLWGSSLLIAPVIYQSHTSKSLYLPTTERWFDYYTGEEQTTLGHINVAAPFDFVPLYIRGGVIIPHQQSAMNTVESRKKPLYLIVALDKEQLASGELFWDDGESIDTYENRLYNLLTFKYNSNRLTVEPWVYNYPQMNNDTKLEDIKIFGLDKNLTRVLWNGQDLQRTNQWTWTATNNVLHIKTLTLKVNKTHKFVFL